jgi:CRP-like cAMP-binding protein
MAAIAQMLEVGRFKAGEAIIVEGTQGQEMYIVETGTAVCTKEGVNDGE